MQAAHALQEVVSAPEPEIHTPRRRTGNVHRITPDQGMRLRRRGDLARLVADRLSRSVDIGPPNQLAIIVADLAVSHRLGLDYETFSAIAKGIGLDFGEPTAMKAIHSVSDIIFRKTRNGGTYRPISGETVAKWLSVTKEERQRLKIRTIGAMDETQDERRARMKEAKRQRDRERQRRNRAGKHKPHALSAERLQPWKAQGISRAAWYRRKKSTCKTDLSPLNLRDSVSDGIVSPQPQLASLSIAHRAIAGMLGTFPPSHVAHLREEILHKINQKTAETQPSWPESTIEKAEAERSDGSPQGARSASGRIPAAHAFVGDSPTVSVLSLRPVPLRLVV